MSSFNKRLLFLLIVSGVAYAHVVSISNGELHVTGRVGSYELRMPSYEVENLAHPETALLDEIRFGNAKRTTSDCKTDVGWLVCHAQYEFAEDVPNKIEVECTLYRVTVPNHVHILYAVQGPNSDQKVFDQNTPSAEIRFHPPSLWESMLHDGSAGAFRLLKSVGGLLFIVVLALTAGSWKEAALLGLTFFTAEWVVRPLVPFIPIGLSPEFLEAVMALTVAYLAAESIFLPAGRARWILVPLFGMVHGLPFAGFPLFYLIGPMFVQVLLLVGFTATFFKMPQSWRKPLAGILFLAAGAWFARFVVPPSK
jgi:hypothetical protein